MVGEVGERAERERRGKERRAERDGDGAPLMEQREPPPRLPLSNSIQHSFPFLISLRPYDCTSKVRPCFLHRRRRSGQTCSMRKFRVVPVSENVLERNTRMWSTKTGAVSEPPKSPSSTRVLASGSMERERSDRVRKVPEADDAARAPVSAAAHAAESRSEPSAPLSSLASDIKHSDKIQTFSL